MSACRRRETRVRGICSSLGVRMALLHTRETVAAGCIEGRSVLFPKGDDLPKHQHGVL